MTTLPCCERNCPDYNGMATLHSERCDCSCHKMRETSPLYKKWENMRNRCNCKTGPNYKHYGARGIGVCERWNDFKNFHDDLYPSYVEHVTLHGKDNTTLDRIDTDKDYTPENCRWATRATQSINRRVNRRVTINGQTKTVFEWSKELGETPRTVALRISRLKMDAMKALVFPFFTQEEVEQARQEGREEMRRAAQKELFRIARRADYADRNEYDIAAEIIGGLTLKD